ncbi:D-aminoacyl-tRNA deacylase [Lachnoanaerobaculum saburreum]|mgnify:FL=1|jgi:D-tyrosyl-tRNA(Tyr) deacylase|uniref:D-aminoacyl-tRNA deacylase n=1 Tax=Lachnoanaerobaculum saburreum DSM 3986 TaxID=887325 RepID=E6LKG5_9FIRM|nr:D-aminoacyl-tRNA deacylase [Lachnoanaerobaculum saburreum]EFU77623.1 D-tyrosyl-tRNA(Tyr) deacylase [Lachnoanaerobaculum saburreum DSM 3986]RKW50535.1 MAG: D-tyrosyl-tRNA(Tyr) deacylase [Lachnospiraceae bacterium]
MKLVIQRVNHADVKIDKKEVGRINKGLLVLVGVASDDDEKTVEKYFNKLVKLRIFEDENGKTNLSLKDVGGELLLVSQFTLLANCKDGNRPSFIGAGSPDEAKRLYEYMVDLGKKSDIHTECGVFGADMKVSLENDGPFTIVLEL